MQDIVVDVNNDLVIEDADVFIGGSTDQHQKHLLISSMADIKEDPNAAVGLYEFLKDEIDGEGLLGVVKEKFERDGMNCKYVNINKEGKLTIDASYK